MATGETVFSSSACTVHKFESKPLTPGEYELRLCADWEVRCAVGEGKLPYLTGAFEVMNTAERDGAKNRKIYHMFFLDLSPARDGVSMVDRGNGIVAFTHAVGIPLEGIKIIQRKKGEDGKQADLLSPNMALAWLNGQEGALLRARVKTEKGQDDRAQSRVDYFIECEPMGGETPVEESHEEVAEESHEEVVEDEVVEEVMPSPITLKQALIAPVKAKQTVATKPAKK